MSDLDAAVAAKLGFYERPDKLTDEQIDPLIRPAVKRINASGWCWTGESCQGHPEADYESWSENTRPMLRLMTRTENVGRMLAALVQSVVGGDEDESYAWTGVEMYPVRWCDGWAEVLIYLKATTVYSRNRALRVYERFAATVTPEYSP